MLTKEIFKNTWARPKIDNRKSKAKGEEKMIVDVEEGNDEKQLTEMEMESVIKIPPLEEKVKKVASKSNGIHNNNMRTWTPLKLPIFGFQYHGIGAVKGKRQHYKSKQQQLQK